MEAQCHRNRCVTDCTDRSLLHHFPISYSLNCVLRSYLPPKLPRCGPILTLGNVSYACGCPNVKDTHWGWISPERFAAWLLPNKFYHLLWLIAVPEFLTISRERQVPNWPPLSQGAVWQNKQELACAQTLVVKAPFDAGYDISIMPQESHFSDNGR